MATTASKPAAYPEREQDLPLTRGARIGLLLLLIVTVAFAFGVLSIKYQLEAFRADVAADLEKRFGARLAMGDVSVNGLRGLRIEELRVEFPVEHGPVLKFATPDAYIHIDLADLFYGLVTVQRIVLDDSTILLQRPADATWYSEEAPKFDDVIPFKVSRGAPFRITGQNCTLDIHNIVGDTKLGIDHFDFDVDRPVDANELRAVLGGNLRGDLRKQLRVRLAMESLEDFDLQVKTDLITADDVNVVLPADRHIVTGGSVHPTIWINGRPNRSIMVTVDAPFENVIVRDQPEFLDPVTGTITVNATYSIDDRNLYLTTAKAETGQVDGSVEGAISFATERPEFDLRLYAQRIPIREILDYTLEGEFEDFGRMDLILDQPNELEVTLTGDTEAPVFRGETRAGSGSFEFEPDDKSWPPIRLALRQIEGAWDSYSRDVRLSFDVADGKIPYERWGIAAESLRGHVTIDNNLMSIQPLNAVSSGNTFVGDGEIDLATGDGRIRFEGTLAGIENTALNDAIRHVQLAGAASVRGEAKRENGNIVVDADVDATQADIQYEWWLRKDPGVGAIGHIRAEIDPETKIRVTATANVASSQLDAELALVRNPQKESGWDIDTVRATSSHIDVNTAARLAVVPYRATGGVATNAHFEFDHDPDDYSIIRQRFGGLIDNLTLTAITDGEPAPIVASGLNVEFELQTDRNRRVPARATARIDAEQLNVPSLGKTWLVAVQPPPGWERPEREWTLDIHARAMELPPWKGREFEGRAYSNAQQNGISPYRALVGDGTIEGTYDGDRTDHTYRATVAWADVPAEYLLDHLKLPRVLEGTISGGVDYTVDRDDPNTLNGKGKFEVRNGRFSADYLADLLEGRMQTDLSAMPPKLDFRLLRSDVEFLSDTVKSPNLYLDSDTLVAEGSGQYIRDGDMDYRLKVAVSPDTAARIPVMASNFNISGHRLSGTPIELTFQIGGPTFNPQGRVEELPPARVTLMSGALEVTRETISLIDFPRKILVDLLKIGGGIVGGGDK